MHNKNICIAASPVLNSLQTTIYYYRTVLQIEQILKKWDCLQYDHFLYTLQHMYCSSSDRRRDLLSLLLHTKDECRP